MRWLELFITDSECGFEQTLGHGERTGKPDIRPQPMGTKRVGHTLATEQQLCFQGIYFISTQECHRLEG